MIMSNENSDILSLSVVVPVKDEGTNIADVYKAIKRMCENWGSSYEIIIVNDGSTDSTKDVCRSFHPLKYVELDRNYGQTAALECGFKLASGDIVAAIDGDGQNDPADIPMMISYMLENNLDAVCGWRKNRKDYFYRRLLTRLAYVFRQVFLHDGIHDSGCTLKVFRKESLEALDLSDGQHRFIPAILQRHGLKVGEIEVSHHPRTKGKSKYNSSRRVFQGLLDMIALKKGEVKGGSVSFVVREIIDC